MLSTRVKVDFMIAGADIMFAIFAALSGKAAFVIFIALGFVMFKIGEHQYKLDNDTPSQENH